MFQSGGSLFHPLGDDTLFLHTLYFKRIMYASMSVKLRLKSGLQQGSPFPDRHMQKDDDRVPMMGAYSSSHIIGGARERVYVGKLKHLTIIASILPAGAIIVCTLIAIFINFDRSTHTHCGVRNLLPSISSMVSETPEKYVWKTAMALHFWPRMLMMLFYYQSNRL